MAPNSKGNIGPAELMRPKISNPPKKESLLKREDYRLTTFTEDFPKLESATPAALAKAGFFYTGQSDRVQCVYCKGILRNWDSGDDPLQEHSRHFHYCRFVQGHDVGNIPIIEDPSAGAPGLVGSRPDCEATDRASAAVRRHTSTAPLAGDVASMDLTEAGSKSDDGILMRVGTVVLPQEQNDENKKKREGNGGCHDDGDEHQKNLSAFSEHQQASEPATGSILLGTDPVVTDYHVSQTTDDEHDTHYGSTLGQHEDDEEILVQPQACQETEVVHEVALAANIVEHDVEVLLTGESQPDGFAGLHEEDNVETMIRERQRVTDFSAATPHVPIPEEVLTRVVGKLEKDGNPASGLPGRDRNGDSESLACSDYPHLFHVEPDHPVYNPVEVVAHLTEYQTTQGHSHKLKNSPFIKPKNRISSFLKYGSNVESFSAQFALGGFCYMNGDDGPADQLQCISCKLTIRPKTKFCNAAFMHISRSRHCPFTKRLLGQEQHTSGVNMTGGGSAATLLLCQRRPSLSASAPTSVLLQGLASGNNQTTSLTSFLEHLNQTPDLQPDVLQTIHKRVVAAYMMGEPDVDVFDSRYYEHVKEILLHHVYYRVKTYAVGWLDSYHAEPGDLSEAGFFYTGQTDRVQCVFCKGVLRNWDRGDVPFEEHIRHFANCRFVQGHVVCNFPFVHLPQTAVPRGNGPAAAIRPRPRTTEERLFESELGVSRARAKHTGLAIEVRRLTSFETWPAALPRPAVAAVAKAGFFYKGTGTDTVCFFCDGQINDWQLTDDPWGRHARMYPGCQFVKNNRSQDFIESHRHTTSLERGVPGRNSPAYLAHFPPLPGGERHTVDEEIIRQFLDTDQARLMTKNGFSRDQVKIAVVKRYEHTGNGFIDPDSLYSALCVLRAEAEVTSDEDDELDSERSFPESSLSHHVSTQDVGSTVGVPESCFGRTASSTEEYMCRRSAVQQTRTRQVLEDSVGVPAMLRTCKVCIDAPVSIVFLPCSHLVCCGECSAALTTCPICRKEIKATVKAFMA